MTCVIFTVAMFLYPLWILFVGALAAMLAGLNRRRGVLPSLFSFFTAASSALVLAPYVFFGQPRTIAAAGGVFLFTLDPISTGLALCLSIISAGYVLQLAGRDIPHTEKGKEMASVLFCTGLAMGAVFSSNLLTMTLFAEASYLLFFAAVRKRSNGVYFPAAHERMFFVPTLFIIFILIFQGITGGSGPLPAMQISELSCFFLVVYALLRLFFFPFTLSSDSMAGIFREPVSACLAVFTSFSGIAMAIKVLAIGPGVSFIVFLVSSMVAGVYSVLAYRQKELDRLMACVYFIGTACTAAVAGLHALMFFTAGREFSLMTGNHFTAAAGLVFTTVMMQKKADRVLSVLFIVFVLAFAGLLPCAGLAGKIGFYREAFREGGNVAIAAFVPCFFSFLPVLFYARWSAMVKKGFAVTGRVTSVGQTAFLWILTANLYLPFLYFMK